MNGDNANLTSVLMIIVPAAVAFGYWQNSWAAGIAYFGLLAMLDHD